MRTLLLTLTLSTLLPGQVTDSFGYTAAATAYSYVDIAGTGTTILGNTDDGTATLTLPFGFRFYGATYNALCVSTNAVLSFGGCLTNDFSPVDLSSALTIPDLPAIAPFWSDLVFTGAGGIVYQTVGTAPNRRFVIQWNNATALNSPGAFNFQVLLDETSGLITFQYQTAESGNIQVSKGAQASIGIRNTLSTTNGQRLPWSYKSPVIANASALLFTPPNAPSGPSEVTNSLRWSSSGLTYNRITRVYSGTLTVTNIGTVPIVRSLTLVLTGLPSGVVAVNAAGTIAGQGPFYLAPGVGPMAPGETVQVPVQFTNAANVTIQFTLRGYSGQL